MELHAGHHMVVQLLGLNVNLDTLMMTWLVAALVIIVTVAATRGRSLVPSGLQNAMEIVIEALLDQFKETLGPKYGQVVSVLLTMFLFILFANELGMLPNPHVLASPTNDLNTTGTGFFLYGPFHGLEEPGVQKAFQALLQALCAVCHHQSDGRNHQALDLGLPSLWQHPGRGNPLGSPVLPRACRRPDDLAPVQLRHRPHPGIHLHHSDYIVSGTVLYGRIMKAQILVTT